MNNKKDGRAVEIIENEIQFELPKVFNEMFLDAAAGGHYGEMACKFTPGDGLHITAGGSGGVLLLNTAALLAYMTLLLADGKEKDPIEELSLIANQAYRIVELNSEEEKEGNHR